jgi:hypothetical protein
MGKTIGTVHIEKAADEEQKGHTLRVEATPDGFLSVVGKIHREDLDDLVKDFAAGFTTGAGNALALLLPLVPSIGEKVLPAIAKLKAARAESERTAHPALRGVGGSSMYAPKIVTLAHDGMVTLAISHEALEPLDRYRARLVLSSEEAVALGEAFRGAGVEADRQAAAEVDRVQQARARGKAGAGSPCGCAPGCGCPVPSLRRVGTLRGKLRPCTTTQSKPRPTGTPAWGSSRTGSSPRAP